MPNRRRRKKQLSTNQPNNQAPSLNALYTAIQTRNVDRFKKLFDERKKVLGSDFHIDEHFCPKNALQKLKKQKTQLTLLACAVMFKNAELVKFLLDEGAGANAKIFPFEGNETTPFELYLLNFFDDKSSKPSKETSLFLNLCLFHFINKDAKILSHKLGNLLALHIICRCLHLFRLPLIKKIATIYAKSQEFKLYAEADKDGNTALHILVKTQKPDVVTIFLNAGADVNIKNKIGLTPIHIATETLKSDMFELLLKHGAYSSNPQEARTIINVAKQGNLNTFNQLMKKKLQTADPTSKEVVTEKIEEGLFAITCKGDISRLQTVITSYANNNLLQTIDIARIQCSFIIGEHYTELNFFNTTLPKGYNDLTTGTDKGQMTALCFAVSCQNIPAIETCLKTGADPNKIVTEKKATSLTYATEIGNVKIIHLLLEAGADPNKQVTEKKMTALMTACAKNYTAAVQALLKSQKLKTDANIQNVEGYAALHYAALSGNLEIVELLIQAGAIQKTYNRRDEAPIHLAIGAGKQQIFERLLNNDSIKFVACNDQITPLITAVRYGRINMVKTLINKGAEIDATDAHRSTALFNCISLKISNSYKIAQLLISNGASLTLDNYYGVNAVTYFSAIGVINDTSKLVFTTYNEKHKGWIYRDKSGAVISLIAIAEFFKNHELVDTLNEIELRRLEKINQEKEPQLEQQNTHETIHAQEPNNLAISARNFCKSRFGLFPEEINKPTLTNENAPIQSLLTSPLPQKKYSWFSGKLCEDSPNVYQVEGSQYPTFVYLDHELLTTQGAEAFTKTIETSRMKFGRRHIKHIPNLGKEFTLINNNNKITTTVKFEIKSRGTAERILLLPINSDPDSSSNCLLLVGAIYRKKGFHQPSDLASFNKLKEEIEINIPETPSEKKSPGLSNHAVK